MVRCHSDCPVQPGSCYSPLEWMVPVHDAIQVLTSMGVTVVATGGNGYNSTAHPAYTRNGLPWFRPDSHSGSILVGAGDSGSRERLGFSNHGPRFDLQGWGRQIVTVAVVAIQSYLRATGQQPWTAQQVVDLIESTGQPQGSDPASEHIGPLPDLRGRADRDREPAPRCRRTPGGHTG